MPTGSERARALLKAGGALGLALGAAAYLLGAGTPVPRDSATTAMGRDGTRLRARPVNFDQGQAGRVMAVGQEDFEIVGLFDKDKNGRLDAEERALARQYVESNGFVRGWGRRGNYGYTPEPGPGLGPEDVQPYPTGGLYEPGVFRTLFLTFENDDWERELMAFKPTDVDVPATLMVDGRTYRNVGVQFHGNSSFNGVPIGFKHSMRLALDFVDEDQALMGSRSLLLLNAHEDPSFLRTMLAMMIAGDYCPAPKVNLVRVVINGESWGVYVNQQHFNRDMTRDLFKVSGGTRWRVHGTRNDVGGGLMYLGEDEAAYRRAYDVRSGDSPKAWDSLRRLTRVLGETPPARVEGAVAPLLDIDSTLRFLAVENVLVNTDGYWTKASDYNLFLDPAGKFHLLPYDVNGTFATGFGPAGSRTGSVWLGPLDAASDPSKPLISRLLAAPALRDRYLGYVRETAEKWLDWNHLGPIVARYQGIIDRDVQADTRKLVSYEAFKASAAELKSFVEERRAILLKATMPGSSGELR